MKKIWVLTREHNDYDQHGGYFVAAFAAKPSVSELADVLEKQSEFVPACSVLQALALIEHIRKGGGRRNVEDVWFNLDETDLL